MTTTPVRPNQLTRDEARRLTDEVKADALVLWRKLLELYEGNAHIALGYKAWGAYYKVEFGGSKSRAYQLLDAGRVLEELHPPTGLDGEWMPHSTIVDSPANEAVAREMVPLLRNGGDAVREAWEETVERNGPAPTAEQVREVVRKRQDPRPREKPIPSKDARVRTLVDELQFWLLTPDGKRGEPARAALALLPDVEADLQADAADDPDAF